MQLPKYIKVRLVIVAILAVLCSALSYNNIVANFSTKEIPKRNDDSLLVVLDKKIDSALFQFGVKDYWIKKSETEIPNAKKKRFTRNVFLATGISQTLINKQLHELSRNYNCEPYASQDLKKLTLSMQMKFEGIIVEQIVLTTTKNLPSPQKPKVNVAEKKVVKNKRKR
ncbi:MAG: hypothetical protein FJ218_02380 [Ignavibacteria bacterium]|nr:hypothetical protein [Ignavibacteria bacterium]